MANKYYRGFEKLFKFSKKPGENIGRNINTIVGVAPSKNIKKFQKQKEKIIKMTDEYKKKVNDPEIKKSMNEGTSETLSKISKIYKGEPITKKVKKVEKKAMGGRIGLKGGGNDMGSTTNKSINSLKNILANRKNRKKSKISKNNFKRDRSPMEVNRVMSKLKSDAQAMGGDIRTAGEMKPLKGESRKSFDSRYKPMKKGGRMGLKKGGGSDLGMQSVIHGVDNNKNITAADPKAKFIAKAKNKKSKKKFI
jgi:hypothetical protein